MQNGVRTLENTLAVSLKFKFSHGISNSGTTYLKKHMYITYITALLITAPKWKQPKVDQRTNG